MEFLTVLRTLARAEVDFLVIGGVAAALHGVPATTFDLDLLHSRAPENRDRLHAVLTELEACYREHLPKILRPSIEDLGEGGHLLLMTRWGPLDLLGTVAEGREFAELEAHAVWMGIGEGLRVRVLSLEELIRLEERTNREKDRLQLSLLRKVLEQRDEARDERDA